MINHLSYSSINLYLMCPEAWRRKYIAKEPTFKTPALAFGGAIHNTIEEYVVKRGKLLEIWERYWNQAISEGGIAWGMDSPEMHYNEGIRILGNDQIIYGLNTIQPKAIEMKVELTVPEVPVPVEGYIDCIGTDNIPLDFKTSSRAWSHEQAQAELQPLFYLAALMQAGEYEHNWRFRHVVITKTKTPKFEIIETTRNHGEIFFLMDMVQKVWKAIETEIFPPNPTGWKCDPKYCDFWANCRGKV